MIGRTANTVLRHSRQKARPPRKVCPYCFEDDHIGGHYHVPHLIVETCQRHHNWLTEERLAADPDMMKRQPTRAKSVEMALRSLAVTGRALAAAMGKLCDALEFLADKLKRG